MTLETLVGAFIFMVAPLADGSQGYALVAGPEMMPLEECMKQSIAINSDETNPFIMICLPKKNDAEARTE